jgi:hypothetical protein
MHDSTPPSPNDNDVRSDLEAFLNQLQQIRRAKLREFEEKEGEDFCGPIYSSPKECPASVLENFISIEPVDFECFFDAQISPLIVDLGLYERGFTEDFCRSLRSMLKSLSLLSAKEFDAWKEGINRNYPINHRRLRFLQESIVLIDILASASPSRHFANTVYASIARSVKADFRIKSGAGAPLGMLGYRAHQLRQKRLSWGQIARKLFGPEATAKDEDRIRMAERRHRERHDRLYKKRT